MKQVAPFGSSVWLLGVSVFPLILQQGALPSRRQPVPGSALPLPKLGSVTFPL